MHVREMCCIIMLKYRPRLPVLLQLIYRLHSVISSWKFLAENQLAECHQTQFWIESTANWVDCWWSPHTLVLHHFRRNLSTPRHTRTETGLPLVGGDEGEMKGGGPQPHLPRANLYGCAATGQVGNSCKWTWRILKKNWDSARIWTWVFWMPVKYSYQCSVIEAQEKWS